MQRTFSWLLLLHVLGAVSACGDGDAPSAGPDGAPGDAGPTDATVSADAAPLSCDGLSANPEVKMLPGFVGNEDITFDREGHVLESDGAHIYKTTKSGQRKVFVANLAVRAGMRMTPSGKLIVNDEVTGSLWRIDPDGSRHQLLTGLMYPNGMEIGKDGKVYFTDQAAEKVYRVDPETGAHVVLTTAVPQPNGLTFDPTYRKLYIGSFCDEANRSVRVLELGADGTPGELRVLASGVGTGCHDGMAVDACGNVYVADYNAATIFRISPDGQKQEPLLAPEGKTGSYHANFDWGSGVGGWDKGKLYVIAVGEGIKEVSLGVPGKER